MIRNDDRAAAVSALDRGQSDSVFLATYPTRSQTYITASSELIYLRLRRGALRQHYSVTPCPSVDPTVE